MLSTVNWSCCKKSRQPRWRRCARRATFVSDNQTVGNNPDNVTVSPRGGVLLCEGGGGALNEKWLTDITEFHIPAGKVYLSPMIDCFDGMVVSWSIGTRADAELVNTMLDAAIEKVAASDDRPLVHSDRGGHYRWPGWLSRSWFARCRERGARQTTPHARASSVV